MADKFDLNYVLASTNHPFSAVWRLTRVMKAAGWNVVAHSDGITKTAAGTNNNDSWGNNANPLNDTYASVSTTIAAGSNGASLPQATINVASTTGFAASGTISIITSTGWQNVTYTGTTGTTFTGCSGGTGTMTTGNPVAAGASTINLDATAAWIVMQGPSTIKLPFTTAPTGTFVRGESITQATTGATGELLGIVWDSTLVTGWAIVAPRTGTFNGSNVVTGAISSATFTPNSIKTFVREVVFAKASSSVVNGSCYYICADSSAESSSLFDTLAASAGCTASIPPGAGGTGNSFPALAITIRGTGGSVSHFAWFYSSTTTFTGYGYLGCVNATPSAGVSADGSFYCMVGKTEVSGSLGLFGFFRLDDTEPGDVDPYVFYWSSGQTLASYNRTLGSTFGSTQYESWGNIGSSNRTYVSFKGYAARDGYVVSRDVSVPFVFTYKTTSSSTYFPMMNSAQPSFMEVVNVPSVGPTYIREPIGLCTTGQTSNIKMYKGSIRWLNIVPTGQYKDTFDQKKWICLFPWANAANPAVIIGPWDGITAPV